MNERSLADLFFQNTSFSNNLYDFSHIVASWPVALKLIVNPEQNPFSGRRGKKEKYTELISWIFNIKMVEWILLPNMESKLCTNLFSLKLWDWLRESWGPPGQGQLQQAKRPFLHMISCPAASYAGLFHLVACRDPRQQEEDGKVF